jgi:hypothetical protein
VKPGNLIRAADGAVKVLDFGLVGIEAEADGLSERDAVGDPFDRGVSRFRVGVALLTVLLEPVGPLLGAVDE